MKLITRKSYHLKPHPELQQTLAMGAAARASSAALPKAKTRSLHSSDLQRVAAGGFGRQGGLGSK